MTQFFTGGIITSDGKNISNDVIEDKICSCKLQNVIKLLIVQACQGKITGDASQKSELATDGPTRIENNLRFRNFARFMSTMNGFQSIRHKTDGKSNLFFYFAFRNFGVLKNCTAIHFFRWSLGRIVVRANLVRGSVTTSEDHDKRLGSRSHTASWEQKGPREWLSSSLPNSRIEEPAGSEDLLSAMYGSAGYRTGVCHPTLMTLPFSSLPTEYSKAGICDVSTCLHARIFHGNNGETFDDETFYPTIHFPQLSNQKEKKARYI